MDAPAIPAPMGSPALHSQTQTPQTSTTTDPPSEATPHPVPTTECPAHTETDRHHPASPTDSTAPPPAFPRVRIPKSHAETPRPPHQQQPHPASNPYSARAKAQTHARTSPRKTSANQPDNTAKRHGYRRAGDDVLRPAAGSSAHPPKDPLQLQRGPPGPSQSTTDSARQSPDPQTKAPLSAPPGSAPARVEAAPTQQEQQAGPTPQLSRGQTWQPRGQTHPRAPPPHQCPPPHRAHSRSTTYEARSNPSRQGGRLRPAHRLLAGPATRIPGLRSRGRSCRGGSPGRWSVGVGTCMRLRGSMGRSDRAWGLGSGGRSCIEGGA